MSVMTIKFKCPHCQARLGAGVKLAGTKGKCPECDKVITVPKKSIKSDDKEKVEKKS